MFCYSTGGRAQAVAQAVAQAQVVAVLRNSGHGENIRVCMG